MKVVVTGASGQLGAVVVARSRARGDEVVALARRDLDVTDHDAVMRIVAGATPDLLINCTAYNAVDAAENDAAAALEANAFAVRSLAAAARETGATLVHYSTDFVFDGSATAPYVETDRARPQSVYGSSKLLGEWFALDAPRAYVLRVASLFGGPAARSSIDRIAQALAAGRAAPVFVDRVVSPTFVDDAAWATETLVERRAEPGLYHCVNSGFATWADVGLEIARVKGVRPRLERISVADVPLKASRPIFAALSPAKLASAGVPMPTWQDAI
ncbi:MAG: NAD(P)-dependent oxidoreductase, partial [Vicinamibacteraceae bacterium]|nr:NAD(P)-dependent oxidoreductase [Vicinamibacteraceae bacterium]